MLRVDLTDRSQLLRILVQLFSYIEPDIEGFEAAVEEFKDRVPELANGLLERRSEEPRNPTLSSSRLSIRSFNSAAVRSTRRFRKRKWKRCLYSIFSLSGSFELSSTTPTVSLDTLALIRELPGELDFVAPNAGRKHTLTLQR